MESTSYFKNINLSPKKLRMLLPNIKAMTPMAAANSLYYMPNHTARIFYKAIKSAMANAKQTLKVGDDLLQFKLFTIEEGQKLKRYRAGSRGSAKPFKRRFSHIKIVLTAKASSPVATKETDKKTKVVDAKKTTEVQAKVAKPTEKKKTAAKKTTKTKDIKNKAKKTA